jgi:hypothetical protein
MPRFEPGNAGGPGRPKGSWGGRRRALQVVDEILADEGNLAALRSALQVRFDADPVKFWVRIAAPLLPSRGKLELELPGDAAVGRGLVAAVAAVLQEKSTP